MASSTVKLCSGVGDQILFKSIENYQSTLVETKDLFNPDFPKV